MTKTILLIDDDPDIHLQTRIIIQKAGYIFYSALSAEAGLDVVQEQSPDLIILDFRMPTKDGLQMFSELQNYFAGREEDGPAVVMLTAASHTFDEKKSLLEFGIDAYLQKPFGPRELINVIENVFVTRDMKRRAAKLTRTIENSRDFLENLIESCPVLIITTDLAGNITFANKAVEDLLNYDPEEVTDKPISLLTKDLEREIEKKVAERTVQPSDSIECSVATASGTRLAVGCRLSLLREKTGAVAGVLIVGQDLSAQKKLEQELVEKERLTALTESFATINHKLNNPLTPLLGNLQLLRQDGQDLGEGSQKRIKIIETNAKKISEIVKSFGELTNPVTKHYYGEMNTIEFINETEPE